MSRSRRPGHEVEEKGNDETVGTVMKEMTDEKRASRISPLAIRTEFEWQQKVRAGYVTNLSEGGAFLATEEAIPVGEKLLLHMFLPRQVGHTEAVVRVIWCSRDAGPRAAHLPCGVGVAFVALAPSALETLRLYIGKFYELAGRLADIDA